MLDSLYVGLKIKWIDIIKCLFLDYNVNNLEINNRVKG